MQTDLAIPQYPKYPVDDFIILDRHAPTGVAPAENASRVNAIATISAGFRQQDNKPGRSLDGTIHVHGEAPGLEAILQRNGGKSLTIMFPSDNPNDFIQQRFAEYSASALLAYGDQNSITVIQGQNRSIYPAGSQGYADALKRCKVSVSVYFTLAEWTETGADVIFPDGFGLYRLRFTSSNSLRSIHSAVRHLAGTTGGRIAYIPFELFIRYEEHTDGTGTKRKVPVWQCVTRPPQGIRLTAQKFRSIMDSGQSQRELLQLNAPAPETFETASAEVADVDLDEAAVTALEAGGLCDAEHYRRTWFATVEGSHFDSDEMRHRFLIRYTNGEFDSLTAFLAQATEQEAAELIESLRASIEDGLVLCRCAVEAKFVNGKSGQGWICGMNPSACDFKMKYQPAPEPEPQYPPVGAAEIPSPVNGMDTESHARQLSKEYKPDDISVLEEAAKEDAAGVMLSDEEVPLHVAGLIEEATNAGFIIESAHRPDEFLTKAVNPILQKKKGAKQVARLTQLDLAQATWVRAAIAKGEVKPPSDETESVQEAEVVS